MSCTPQSASVSNTRLSVATTDCGGAGTVCSPLLSVTVTVAEDAWVSEAFWALAPHPTRASAATALSATPGINRFMDMDLLAISRGRLLRAASH